MVYNFLRTDLSLSGTLDEIDHNCCFLSGIQIWIMKRLRWEHRKDCHPRATCPYINMPSSCFGCQWYLSLFSDWLFWSSVITKSHLSKYFAWICMVSAHKPPKIFLSKINFCLIISNISPLRSTSGETIIQVSSFYACVVWLMQKFDSKIIIIKW